MMFPEDKAEAADSVTGFGLEGKRPRLPFRLSVLTTEQEQEYVNNARIHTCY